MASSTNTQVVLIKRPTGLPDPAETFRVETSPIPTPGDGQVLIHNIYLSLDPAMRIWMKDVKSYLPPVGIGEVMRGITIGEVVESKSDDFAKGDIVQTMGGWQEYSLADAPKVSKLVIPSNLSIAEAFGLVGLTGLSAYFGLLDIGKPKPGDTVVVSGAAGATGSIAGQIAKIQGCRVIGIAGGEEKCRILKEEFGFDVAIDYRSPTFKKELEEATPDYINVYFDNVGGDILDAVLGRLAKNARISLCGAISQYNSTSPVGPKNYMSLIAQRATMQGFLILDYSSEFDKGRADLIKWQSEGKLKVKLHVVEGGVKEAPEATLKLFNGGNLGKLLVRIRPEPTR